MSPLAPRIGPDRRSWPRYYVNLDSRLAGPQVSIRAWTIDISGGGARIGLGTLTRAAFEGPGWELDIPGLGAYPVERSWNRGTTYGVAFTIPAQARERLAILLAALLPAPE